MTTVNNDLGRTWKQAIVDYFKVLFQILPGGTGENHEKSLGIPDIRFTLEHDISSQ
jgi:hypothetical protein